MCVYDFYKSVIGTEKGLLSSGIVYVGLRLDQVRKVCLSINF